MRVVLDTNIVVAALVYRGRLSSIATAAVAGTVVPVVSRALVAEYLAVLARPKFGMAEETAAAQLRAVFLDGAQFVEPQHVEPICRDSDDDAWVALAREAGVPLVTGDRDILALRGKVEGLEVWPAAELVEKLAA